LVFHVRSCQIVRWCAYWGQAARRMNVAGLPAAVADALLVDFRRASSPAMNVAGLLAAVAHALLGPLWDR
jgi:ABC-type enterochelin transport system permease subunit